MDADFRAARIDTGYLERMRAGSAPVEEVTVPEDVVAIAAALLAASARDSTPPAAEAKPSQWAAAARQEGLRA
jgi:acetyl-CoA carboxylase biotin carboxylase subunit